MARCARGVEQPERRDVYVVGRGQLGDTGRGEEQPERRGLARRIRGGAWPVRQGAAGAARHGEADPRQGTSRFGEASPRQGAALGSPWRPPARGGRAARGRELQSTAALEASRREGSGGSGREAAEHGRTCSFSFRWKIEGSGENGSCFCIGC